MIAARDVYAMCSSYSGSAGVPERVLLGKGFITSYTITDSIMVKMKVKSKTFCCLGADGRQPQCSIKYKDPISPVSLNEYRYDIAPQCQIRLAMAAWSK